MEVRELEIRGILEIRPNVFEDERGYFFESFNEKTFAKLGIQNQFVQDNQSYSKKGTIRGLHFQLPPYEQGKLISVVSGKALDAVVDIRKTSPTFGQILTVELSGDDRRFIYIPPGFAHGFSALEDCVFQYKCTKGYEKASESGIYPLDSDLNIDWKITNPMISGKDKELPAFSAFRSPF
jgi:dTDP-4-dehydrorhamnose 3,5-epimerase